MLVVEKPMSDTQQKPSHGKFGQKLHELPVSNGVIVQNSSARINPKDVFVWSPVQACEPIDMLIQWISDVEAVGFCNFVLVINGLGSESVCKELRKAATGGQVQIEFLSGPASIGRCQNLVMHLFLSSDARFMVRVDSDGQFPIWSIDRLLLPFTEQSPPDVVIGQRDEASVSGRKRFLANIFLRMVSLHCGIFGDPNSGCYIINHRAAANLCRVPLTRYPEPRMLKILQEASLTVTARVIPTLQRKAGRSSIKGFWASLKLFVESLLEMVSCTLL